MTSLPFSRHEFLQVFAAYNEANWLAALAAYPLAIAALTAAWRSSPAAGRQVAFILSLMWGWVGGVYHGIYFAPINPVARAFAAAFLVQAALLAIHGFTGRGLEFGPRSRARAVSGGLLIAYAMIAYPLIGLLAGDRYPAMPLFGIAPCPLLIFTFGLMLWANCAKWWLWIVPILWSVVGGSAAILLSVPQDWALPISAVLVLAIIVAERTNRRSGQSALGPCPGIRIARPANSPSCDER